MGSQIWDTAADKPGRGPVDAVPVLNALYKLLSEQRSTPLPLSAPCDTLRGIAGPLPRPTVLGDRSANGESTS